MPDDVKRNVDTEGGAAIDGSVNAGGDFVGRDQETHVSAEDHSVAVGRDVHGDLYVYHGTAPSPDSPYERPTNVEEALDRYCKCVIRHHGRTRIFSQSEAVSVEGIFTQINVLKRPPAWERCSPAELESLFRQRETRRVAGLGYVSEPQHDRLIILGKPGAGKTTFLRYLALQPAQGALDRVPILITLKDWAASKVTLGFVKV